MKKLLTLNFSLLTEQVPGGHTGGVPPVPIPNTEVKPSKADATAAARQWESRTLPGYKKPADRKVSGLFHLSEERTLNWLADRMADPLCSPTAHVGTN